MSTIVLRTIKFDLSQRGLANAIREVRRFQKDLVKAINALIERLTQEGAEVAKVYVQEMDAIDTGQLEQSIYGYFNPDSRIGYVIAGAPYAIYVEFGTGIIGKAIPHPMAQDVGWEYDVNHHGTEGWVYNKGSDGVFSDGNVEYHWTLGYEARPFMYETLRTLEGMAERICANVMKEELKG